ncbi:butyrophilin subfamily 1 member A1-like [Thalassophryne amazonica]|uniref:butyrophilin subfamily 1 member A1-like n=1 Tax=Thalassophryne amazonica TaxID=390379 RepID=UPI001471D7A9|nr:butyrophilin subfamily 1 member A1-like [Thalassophryne amazonica]
MITVMLSPAEGEAPFAVNVTQDVYEAEENSNVTLTWFFTVSRDTQPQDLVVDISRHETVRSVYLYHRGEESTQYVDQLYRGRFSCNKELLETGRIECVFRNVTVSDSGLYVCLVVIDRKGAQKLCLLNVTGELVFL